MANRYDTYIHTNYAPSPLDYYQMAMGAKEQEYGSQLQDIGNQFTNEAGVEAIYNPDKELRDEILGNIRSQVEQVAKGDASAPMNLLKLKRIASDRNTVEQLAGIAGNTANYSRVMQEVQDYKKKYGNEFNVTPIMAQIHDYNTRGKAGYQKAFLQGTSPDDYIDVVKGLRDVLGSVKADVTDVQNVNGQWIVRTKDGSLRLDKLMSTAGIEINDPKYQRQLQNIIFHNAYTAGGGDVNKGYEQFRSSKLQNLDQQIATTEQHMAMVDINKKGGVKQREDLASELQQLRGARSEAASAKDYGNHYAGDLMQSMALMAAKPFAHTDFTQGIKENPFAAIQMRADLALRNQREKLKATQKMLFPPDPPMVLSSGSTTVNPNLQANAFNQHFTDLDVNDQGIPNVKGTRSRAVAIPGGPGAVVGLTNESFDNLDKWKGFIREANDHGFNIDQKIIENDPTGKTPEGKKELTKLGVVYKNLKASNENDTLVNFGVNLSAAGTNPTFLGTHIMNLVNGQGNTVEMGDGTKKTIQEIIPASKTSGITPEIAKDLKVTLNPMGNKYIVSYRGGAPFLVNPDIETQERLAPLAKLFNSPNKVEEQNINGKEYVSYNTYDKNYKRVHDLLQAPQVQYTDGTTSTARFNIDDFATQVAKHVGLRDASAIKEHLGALRDDQVYVLSTSPRTGAVQRQRYVDYVRERENRSDPMEYARIAHSNPVFVLKKTIAGKAVFIPLQKADSNPIDLMKDQTQSLFKGGGPLSATLDKNNVDVNKVMTQFFGQSGFTDDDYSGTGEYQPPASDSDSQE